MKPRCSGSTLVHIWEEKMNNYIDLFMSLILFWLICIANKEEEKRTAGENQENMFFFFWVSHVDYLSICSMNPNQIFRCWQRGNQTKKKGAVA